MAEKSDIRDERIRELELANTLLLQQLSNMGTQLSTMATQLARSNERLDEVLVILERRKAGKRRKKTDKPTGTPPDLTDAQKRAFENRPTPPPTTEKPAKKKTKQRRPGRNPLPSSLPVDEHESRPTVCPCGCEDFAIVDEIIEEKLDIKAHHRIRRTHRLTGKCRHCGKRTTGEALPSPFARSKATCQWLAWFITQKFQLLVPLDRLRRYLGVAGLSLSMSYLVTQTERVCDLLAPIDGYHWKQLLAGWCMATDGTGFKVQIPKVGLHHGFFEVYHWDEIVVFHYEAEKGGQTQMKKLAKFEGTLLVDAESRYNLTFQTYDGQIFEANCHAHPRRKLRDAEGCQPVLAADGGRFITAMFEQERLAKERKLVGPELVAWRIERIKPIWEEFRIWKDSVLATLIPDDPLAKVLRYYQNHWTGLSRFLIDPVPLDNSKAEREFQPIAKLRANSLFAGGTEGAFRSVVTLGIVATCKRLNVSFEAYLTWLMIRQGTHRHKYKLDVSELTPAAYKRSVIAA